ncbi:MAG: hypothetical protein JSV78_12260 [Phycisphaerales bacterium]|nr:MAG: hypothetical protein JSV78_12260 [Phycisphaerales bacterium]
MTQEYKVDSTRQTQRTIQVVSGLYVVIGLLVTAVSAFTGHVAFALVGLIIVSLAVVGGVLLHNILRLGRRAALVEDRLQGIDSALARVEERLAQIHGSQTAGTDAEEMVDLTAIGPGDPGLLTNAVLDRGRFPRLVATMADAPDGEVSSSSHSSYARKHMPGGNSSEAGNSAVPAAPPSEPMQEDAIHRWEIALVCGNLATCRALFSILVDTASPDLVAELEEQLGDLERRTARRLREAFNEDVRREDYAGALETGTEILRLLPKSSIAADFERIRPHLLRRVERASQARRAVAWL